MGFQTLATKFVALADSISNTLQVTVQHYAWISDGTYGEPEYASAVPRQAIVELKQRLRRLDSGQEVLQRAAIMFPRPIAANGATNRREPIDPRDKFVLPNGYTGPILNVDGIVNPDTSKPYALEVILG